jgi:hypothetical protein
MKRHVFALALCAALAACGQDSDAHVVQAGHFAVEGTVGVGALLRVEGTSTVTDIPLRLSFYDGDRLVASERSTLPFCTPRTDCYWGEEYSRTTIGSDLDEIDRVEVDAGSGEEFDERTHRVVELKGQTGRTRVDVPGRGVVYFVLERDGRPTWGSAVQTTGRTILQSPAILDHGDVMRSFYYVGASVERAEPGAD